MALVEVDTTELDDLIRVFEKRADHMVEDAIRDGMARAQSYQASKVAHPGIMHRPIKRLRQPHKRASAFLQARFIERAFFYRLIHFFGAW